MLENYSEPQRDAARIEALRTLERIERRALQKRSFLRGILCGFVLTLVLSALLGLLAWFNRDLIAEKAMNYLVTEFFEESFKYFPDAYVSNNRDRVLQVFDDFANAAAANQITREEFGRVARKVIAALRDRRLTYQEIGAILDLMEEVAKTNR